MTCIQGQVWPECCGGGGGGTSKISVGRVNQNINILCDSCVNGVPWFKVKHGPAEIIHL